MCVMCVVWDVVPRCVNGVSTTSRGDMLDKDRGGLGVCVW